MLCSLWQVGWTTVFFWEYFGPLLTYSFIYFFPQFVYFSYRFAQNHLRLIIDAIAACTLA